jgi:hypothetical protein
MTQLDTINTIRSEAANQSAQQNTGLELYRTIGPLLDNLVNDGVTLDDLPTEDPAVDGQLWNDTGTPTVSAG